MDAEQKRAVMAEFMAERSRRCEWIPLTKPELRALIDDVAASADTDKTRHPEQSIEAMRREAMRLLAECQRHELRNRVLDKIDPPKPVERPKPERLTDSVGRPV